MRTEVGHCPIRPYLGYDPSFPSSYSVCPLLSLPLFPPFVEPSLQSLSIQPEYVFPLPIPPTLLTVSKSPALLPSLPPCLPVPPPPYHPRLRGSRAQGGAREDQRTAASDKPQPPAAGAPRVVRAIPLLRTPGRRRQATSSHLPRHRVRHSGGTSCWQCRRGPRDGWLRP